MAGRPAATRAAAAAVVRQALVLVEDAEAFLATVASRQYQDTKQHVSHGDCACYPAHSVS